MAVAMVFLPQMLRYMLSSSGRIGLKKQVFLIKKESLDRKIIGPIQIYGK